MKKIVNGAAVFAAHRATGTPKCPSAPGRPMHSTGRWSAAAASRPSTAAEISSRSASSRRASSL